MAAESLFRCRIRTFVLVKKSVFARFALGGGGGCSSAGVSVCTFCTSKASKLAVPVLRARVGLALEHNRYGQFTCFTSTKKQVRPVYLLYYYLFCVRALASRSSLKFSGSAAPRSNTSLARSDVTDALRSASSSREPNCEANSRYVWNRYGQFTCFTTEERLQLARAQLRSEFYVCMEQVRPVYLLYY